MNPPPNESPSTGCCLVPADLIRPSSKLLNSEAIILRAESNAGKSRFGLNPIQERAFPKWKLVPSEDCAPRRVCLARSRLNKPERFEVFLVFW
jgi:hypothetical protein